MKTLPHIENLLEDTDGLHQPAPAVSANPLRMKVAGFSLFLLSLCVCVCVRFAFFFGGGREQPT